MPPRNVAILIFNDVEVLDFAGPFEVFGVSRNADEPPQKLFNVYTVAQSAGPVLARNGLSVNPAYTLADCPKPDLLLVPGGQGTRREINNPVLVNWIKAKAAKVELMLSVIPEKTVIYARVSSADNKQNLNTQAERLVRYCEANGYQVHVIYKEIGSGLNDSRRQLSKMLDDHTITRIVVEHKDRLTRFGFNYIELLLRQRGCTIEVVNLADDGKEDLVEDLVSIIYSFCARLYGQRRAKRKTETITRELELDNDASR